MQLATRDEMAQINRTALRVNEILTDFMREISVELIDFKLEFGRYDGRVLVADEISPDTSRFWDARPMNRWTSDRFQGATWNVEPAYRKL